MEVNRLLIQNPNHLIRIIMAVYTHLQRSLQMSSPIFTQMMINMIRFHRSTLGKFAPAQDSLVENRLIAC